MGLMLKPGQKGVAHLLIVLILLAGIIAGLILVKNPAIFKPRAGGLKPTTPETSFTLVQEFEDKTYKIKLYVRSDLDSANLFSARLKFPKELLEVVGIGTDTKEEQPVASPEDKDKTPQPVKLPKDFQVEEAIPAVVALDCHFGDELIEQGSGASVYVGDEHMILTNAHVVKDENGNLTDGCWVYFPRSDGSFYESVYWAGEATAYDTTTTVIDEVEVGGEDSQTGGLDFAVLRITEPEEVTNFPDLFSIEHQTCQEINRQVEGGERLFVLGFPPAEGDDMTVAEGIVKGLEGHFNEWVVTSARIASGHSGGVTVMAKDGCLLGIPTRSFLEEEGAKEDKGFILTYGFIDRFLNQAFPQQDESPNLQNSFITNWVEQNFDNNAGTVSLVGGVPNPGFQTTVGDKSALMATIVFRPKKVGKGVIGFSDLSAIYRNSDNLNILTIKRDLEIEISRPVPSGNLLPPGDVVCTQDVKQCPDGSSVGRNPKNKCEFYPCPLTNVPGKGDGNKDGKIDLIDMSVLLLWWNKEGLPEIDLNSDGKINTFDFSLMRNLLIQHKVIKG